MPYKKYTKKPRRKYRKRYNRRSLVAQPQAVIADSQLVKMKYCDMFTINSVAGVADGAVISANSVFDPLNYGPGGRNAQPLGHDEWALFYNHATVIGSKIKVTFMPTSNTLVTANNICSVKLLGNNSLDTNIFSTLEQTGNKWKLLGSADASPQGTTLYHNFSAKKFFGITNVRDADNIRGTFGSNPSDQAYWHLQCSALNGTDDPAAVDVIITVEYICLLSERRQLSGS